jgi:cell division protein FtsB
VPGAAERARAPRGPGSRRTTAVARTPVRRLRLVFVVTLVTCLVFLGFELPASELLAERSATGATAAELRSLDASATRLRASISELHQSSTIAALAQSELGLVAKGQRVDLVLPSGTAARSAETSSSALQNRALPPSVFVPSDAAITAALGAPSAANRAALPGERSSNAARGHEDRSGRAGSPSPGFFTEVLHHLEFWRTAF